MYLAFESVFFEIYLKRSVVTQSILESEASIYHLISVNSSLDVFIVWCIHRLMHSSRSNVFVDIYLERSVVAQSILQSEASIYRLIAMNSLHGTKCFLRKCNCFGLHRLRLSTFMTPISSWRYILMPFPFPNVSKSCHHCCSLETWVFD